MGENIKLILNIFNYNNPFPKGLSNIIIVNREKLKGRPNNFKKTPEIDQK